MATGVFMPKLSMTMEKGTIIQWFKKQGDDVQTGDVLLEVMTDKINIEVESYASGKLLKIYYGADDVVPVNEVIAYIGSADEIVPDSPPRLDQSKAAPADNRVARREAQELPDHTACTKKLRATPVARRIAREHGIALDQVSGTGPHGRIHKEDVMLHLSSQGVSEKELIQSVNPPPARTESHHRKLEGMRKVIAQRMVQSAFTAPHVTLATEADMSRAIELRSELLPEIEKSTGVRLSFTDIIVKAVSTALQRHPHVNVSLQNDCILYHADINVGIAVAVREGLLVPVVKNAAHRGLAELAVECKRLTGLAREGRLHPDDMQGGTFTISNLGMYSIDTFTPIINQPESAILGVGRIHEKPAGLNGQIVLRPLMSLSLSFDHRVIDGAPAAAFVEELKNILESPYRLLL